MNSKMILKIIKIVIKNVLIITIMMKMVIINVLMKKFVLIIIINLLKRKIDVLINAKMIIFINMNIIINAI